MKTKTILITGASHGIGKAIAARFAAEGFSLVLNCKNDIDILHDYADRLSHTCGIQALAIPGDVSDHDFVREMFARAQASFDGIDVLVNNAGISHIGLLTDLSIDDWNRVIATNLTSVFSCCHEAVPYMVRRKSGCIINISSVWGNVGASTEVAYSASKGGLNAFTRALAKELAPSNIQVNAIACGIIDTDMNHCFSQEEIDSIIEEIPADRLGTAQEAARMVLQIINSPAYLTGQIITLDGGWQ